MNSKAIGLIKESSELINWLDEQVGEPDISSDIRTRVSAACISLVRQHHRAIVSLVQNDLHGSAAALARVIWEAHIKSIWYYQCATDADLQLLI